jgi:import inner membrane translocase subunit TIM21
MTAMRSLLPACRAILIQPVRRHHPQSLLLRRPASSGTTKRRSVTPFNDDGHVPWSELSTSEKAARSAQQGFNYSLAAFGLFLTLGISYIMWTEVFAPESRTNQFSRAVRRIKQDQRCIDALGPARKLSAHGDSSWSSLRRPRERPVACVLVFESDLFYDCAADPAIGPP